MYKNYMYNKRLGPGFGRRVFHLLAFLKACIASFVSTYIHKTQNLASWHNQEQKFKPTFLRLSKTFRKMSLSDTRLRFFLAYSWTRKKLNNDAHLKNVAPVLVWDCNLLLSDAFTTAEMVMGLFTLIHLACWKKCAHTPLLNGILPSLQCKRLEQELHHLKEQNQTSANNTRHLTAENNQERALKVNLHFFLQAN